MNYLFSSIKLFKLLKERDIGAVGTLWTNPGRFSWSRALKRKHFCYWYHLGTVPCADRNVLALTWIDKGPVQMLTTAHILSINHRFNRVYKKPRLVSTSGFRVCSVFEDSATKSLRIPEIINDYNTFQGGVDISDQLQSVCTLYMASTRTWMLPFVWLLAISITNIYIMLSELDETGTNRHRKVCIDFAWKLVEERDTRNVIGVSNCASLSFITESPNISTKRCALRDSYVTNSKKEHTQIFSRAEEHIPLRGTSTKCLTCFGCWREGKRSRTSFSCSSFGLYLRIKSNRNCIQKLQSDILGTHSKKTLSDWVENPHP